MCCHVPAHLTFESNQPTRGEIPGANRLEGERKEVKKAGAEILSENDASIFMMTDKIRKLNPRSIHIAGHTRRSENDPPRLVGFYPGDDEPNVQTKVSPVNLAKAIVKSAKMGAPASDSACELACVILNFCHSASFGQEIIALAKKEGLNQVHAICWSGLTTDLVCRWFARGFYHVYGEVQDFRDTSWIAKCYEFGRLQVEMLGDVELTKNVDE